MESILRKLVMNSEEVFDDAEARALANWLRHWAICFPPSCSRLLIFNKLKTLFINAVRLLFEQQHACILYIVLSIRQGLQIAASCHISESEQFYAEAAKWEQLMVNALQLKTLDDPRNLKLLLFSGKTVGVVDNSSASETVKIDVQGKVFYKNRKSNFKHYENIQILGSYEFLGRCLEWGAAFPFAFAAITSHVRKTFWGKYTFSSLLYVLGPMRYKATAGTAQRATLTDRNRVNIFDDVCKIWWNPRSCPGLMFFLEGTSKAVMLGLASFVSVREYGYDGNFRYHESPVQIALLVFVSTTILYEFGQYLDRPSFNLVTKMTEYLDWWNFFDVCTNFLVLLWALLLRLKSHQVARQICLALSLIPLTVSLLQYLLYFRALGELVILSMAMMRDLFKFFFIFVVFALGFGLCLWGLFAHTPGAFGGLGFTIINLFAAMLGGINYSLLEGYPNTLDNVTALVRGNVDDYKLSYDEQVGQHLSNTGIVVYVAFVTLCGIVLINLLIARMTGTHDRIEAAAAAQWGFFQVL